MTGALTDLLKGFIDFVPNLMGALMVLLVGFIIARVLRKIIRIALEKAKVDVLGEKLNDIDIIEKSKVKIKLSAIFSKLIYFILMLFVWVAATDVLGMEAISNLVTDIFTFIPNLLVAFIILIIGLLLGDIIRKAVVTACESLGIPSAKLIASLVFYFIFINIIISALSQAKINVEFLSQNISLVIGGAVLAFSIGYGLAAKEILANFLASFYGKNLFKLGDQVKIDGVEGEVIAIERSSVTLLSEGKQIIIPFSRAINNKIEKTI
ncbi:mechanosensitive ion channel family protein [Portibacter lacus]|nr:mechanosensitive ion channel domain-containing protein [Portibacter lacus]